MTQFFLRSKGGGSGGGSSIPGLTITNINGQPMLTLEDTTRGNKILSVAEQPIQWAENGLTNLDWIRIGNANDAESGYVADFDGTIVFASAHCENTGSNTKEIHLYVNNTDIGSIGTLSGGTNATFINTTANIDFSQGDRIRLRAVNATGGSPEPGNGAIQDTVIKLTLKWRG